MPSYDYRCKDCGEQFSLFYKTYAEYDAATPRCPACESDVLSRLITSVRFAKPSRDYTGMSSKEMLSVLDSGDSRQVGEMFQQVGGGSPELGKEYHDATNQLLNGERIEKVEERLQDSDKAAKKDDG
jgi:putative FmdB family regulatory protein